MEKNRLLVDGELMLYGPVGFRDFFEDAGFTADQVVEALAEMDGDITVRLNSGGGAATEGAAIYNALRRHDGKVTVSVDGIAASAASLIAMAGDEIVMPLGSLMMLHEPAGITMGPADAHRKTAAVLDTMIGVYAEVYATRSGRSELEIRKMMKAETWLTAKDAVDKGLATIGSDDLESIEADAAFDYRTYRNAPARLVALAMARQSESLPMVAVARSAPLETQQKGTIMSRTALLQADQQHPADPEPTTPEPAPAPPPEEPAEPTEPEEEVPPTASANDATLELKIYRRCVGRGLNAAETEKVIARAKGSYEMAQDLIIDAVAARDPDGGRSSPALVVADSRDRFKQGVEKSLLFKARLDGGEVNEFSSMTLREIARMSLDRAGIKYQTRDPMMMVGAALGMRSFIMAGGWHTTSDFTDVLANVASKAMLKGYMEADETFPQWTSAGTLTDFKAAYRVDLNLFPSLATVPEGAEYTFGSMGDRGESIQLATYGKMFAISRQAIINDDLSAFTRVPQRMGRAASRTIGSLVYAILTSNPVMSDGVTLFHANHNNTTTGLLTTATLDAARAKMAVQKDPDSYAAGGLNIRPAFLLVPVALGGKARQLVTSEYEILASGSTATRNPNYVQGIVNVIDEARLDTDSVAEWYLAASPSATDTIEVAYLNGVSQPTLEQRDGWYVDGVEFKVRIDAGVKALDYRGLLYSTGA